MSDQAAQAPRSYDGWYAYSVPGGGQGRCYLQIYEPRPDAPNGFRGRFPDTLTTSPVGCHVILLFCCYQGR